MTHLQSLIAKAKAATPGKRFLRYDAEKFTWELGGERRPITHGDLAGDWPIESQADDLRFIAAASPHLILALCELAMAAEVFTKLLDQLMDENDPGRKGNIAGAANVAEKNIRAKLAAVRGVSP